MRVNTVSPGAVRTARRTKPGGAADIFAAMTGSEVADTILLLASPRSASTVGADFAVDAGFLEAF
ncbi:SDR family oxidoreductase [Streptomyces montanisoli]|uniref:SDR family oxidoreductase n=1 Tax=Streptomyces montanisoli TaxID=2798581 RepID=A0A940RWQ9_9ACTN|nr:SDR family oxidoreductase [Streptomyces montanisoli]MBP0459730.1 SDR family oxidoreductase [Streptomyces montanisoli]